MPAIPCSPLTPRASIPHPPLLCILGNTALTESKGQDFCCPRPLGLRFWASFFLRLILRASLGVLRAEQPVSGLLQHSLIHLAGQRKA